MKRRYARVRDLVHCTSHFGAALVVSRIVLEKLRLDAVQRRLHRLAERYTESRARAFDALHGTDTFQRIDLGDLGLGGTDESFRHWQYGPINQDFFREIVSSLPAELSGMTFFDVGSGKGLALMLASEYGFRRLVGVDFSAELLAIARKNLVSYGTARGSAVEAELICADFLQLELPAEPTVYFLNNPFPEHIGHLALTHLLESLQAAPREAFIVWRRCTLPLIDRMDESPLLDLAVATPYWRIYRTRAGEAR